jgi:hypothetical protein
MGDGLARPAEGIATPGLEVDTGGLGGGGADPGSDGGGARTSVAVLGAISGACTAVDSGAGRAGTDRVCTGERGAAFAVARPRTPVVSTFFDVGVPRVNRAGAFAVGAVVCCVLTVLIPTALSDVAGPLSRAGPDVVPEGLLSLGACGSTRLVSNATPGHPKRSLAADKPARISAMTIAAPTFEARGPRVEGRTAIAAGCGFRPTRAGLTTGRGVPSTRPDDSNFGGFAGKIRGWASGFSLGNASSGSAGGAIRISGACSLRSSRGNVPVCDSMAYRPNA